MTNTEWLQIQADNYAPEDAAEREYERRLYGSKARVFVAHRRAGVKSATFRLNGAL